MDAKDIDRLKKLLALGDSPNEGERNNAIAQAGGLLKRHGKSMVDLPEILGRQAGATSPFGSGFDYEKWARDYAANCAARDEEARRAERWGYWPNGDGTCSKYNLNNPQEAAAHDERCRKADEEKRRKEAPEREAIIKRYGSMEAALAPCEREKLLRAAVKQWSKFWAKPDQRWTKSIDGCTSAYKFMNNDKDVPKRVLNAISQAYQMPDNITDAIAEYAYWQRRIREMRLAGLDRGDQVSDLTVEIRYCIISDLVETGLRARSTHDVLLRLRFSGDYCQSRISDEIKEALIADLDALCAADKIETVVSHEEFRAARQKREKPAVKQPRKVSMAQRDFGF